MKTFRYRWKSAAACLPALLLAGQCLFAQGSGTIKGHVTDQTTGDPLPGATVVVQGTSLGSTTSLDGIYAIRSVPQGTHVLKASYIGYVGQTLEVAIVQDTVLVQNFALTSQALPGEEVVVTAQAQGQKQAINQQLASNTISNIVAADRIKELPDVSAAESIGRLPGMSIDRYNGEATGVAIRGMAPKYNTVTVNGVVLPATNNNDRSVDLSLISSNVLDGIEVKKANTPDMDADAFGGTIDMRLKEASEGLQANATLQGGYNKLSSYYRNYSTIVGLSDRFFDNKLGIIAVMNSDKNNRDADKLTATYVPFTSGAAGIATADQILLDNFDSRKEEVTKTRLGGMVLADYRIPNGSVTGNIFYNQAKTDGTYRFDHMDFAHFSHYYNLQAGISTNSLYTSTLGMNQDFGWVKYDAAYSATGSKTDEPNRYQWQFSQENNAGTKPTPNLALAEIYPFETPHDSGTGIRSAFLQSTKLVESQRTVQMNFQIPFTLTTDLSGYVKAGGKLRFLRRNFDQEQWGHDNLQYGGSWTGVNSNLVHALSLMYPNDYNVAGDSASINSSGLWNLFRFDRGYTPQSGFLGGQYRLGPSPDLRLLTELTNGLKTLSSDNWQRQSLGSLGYDYDGIEEYHAGYIMTELNIGPYISFLPGVRYDVDFTKYHGQTFREVSSAGKQLPPVDYQVNEAVRRNVFWLPMVHLKVHPIEWLRIQLAATQTVTRPDYNMYAPITSNNQYGNVIVAGNASMKDAWSKNLDASASIYEEHIGLVTVSGFYKKIDNLILYQQVQGADSNVYKGLAANLNVPMTWFVGGARAQISTYMNNPTPGQLRGVEFEWQTNFWYLPSVFKGLVLNVNWTFITSDIQLHRYAVDQVTVPLPPPRRGFVTTYVARPFTTPSRIPDQPAHIFNTTLGYDFKGFSLRVAYLYQSDKFTDIAADQLTDGFTNAYGRWDIAVQQRVGGNVQFYCNANNLNNIHDESNAGHREVDPTSLQYYGSTIDVGVRYNY